MRGRSPLSNPNIGAQAPAPAHSHGRNAASGENREAAAQALRQLARALGRQAGREAPVRRRRRGVAPAVALLPIDVQAAKPIAEAVVPEVACTAEPLPKRLLRPAEVMELLSLSERSLRRHARLGVLPAMQIGRSVRYRISDIQKYLDIGIG